MLDKVLISFLITDALFAATGGLFLAVVFVTKATIHRPRTTADVASNLLLLQTPLTGGRSLTVLHPDLTRVQVQSSTRV